jgi:phosphoglycerate dehydrogenase-like enzyme
MTAAKPKPKGGDLTVFLYHPSADEYAAMIRKRFPNVRVVSGNDQAALDRHMREADILLSSRFPVDAFDKARRLRWFQCTNAGVDSIMPIRNRVGDLQVTNARGIHGGIIADFVMAGLTMLHWNFKGFLQQQTEKEWKPRYVAPLADKTLGVIGLGSIGSEIARRAKSAYMTVVGSKRNVHKTVDGVDRLFQPSGLNELLPLCDFVVLAVPGTPDTIGLLGRAEFGLMRRDAFLVNIARGNVVVEDELILALSDGTIAGALLDVFEKEPLAETSPLWTMPNVIVTPHVAGNPTGYASRVFDIFGDNLERFLEGKPLRNLVDLDRGY